MQIVNRPHITGGSHPRSASAARFSRLVVPSGYPHPTQEEILWWLMFETHRKSRNLHEAQKPEADCEMGSKSPPDSAEYKMGNGVALPCVCLVPAGIVDLPVAAT